MSIISKIKKKIIQNSGYVVLVSLFLAIYCFSVAETTDDEILQSVLRIVGFLGFIGSLLWARYYEK
ncbi:hypothetical protein [Pectobacterium cacticida]|uniref:hypothetical protein n=1 Tax=Pectobacterium cacticida TaxID=69221 RepID=UPI002FF12E32